MGSTEQRGVTLIELLVATTIVGLLAATALIAWRVGISAWERAGERLEHDRSVLAVHQIVAEQIASMAPVQMQVEQRGRVLFFQGEPEIARFVSRHSLAHRAGSGLYLVEYRVEEESGASSIAGVTDSFGAAKRFILQETPLWGVEQIGAKVAGIENESGKLRMRFVPFEAGPTTVVLAGGLEECRFEYYLPATNQQQPGGWVEQWSEAGNELPRAMRIVVKARESGDLEPVTIAATIRNHARPPVRPLGLP